jgi:hypothetical protein
MAPSFWVSAQWKIFWYSVGSDSWAGIAIRELRSTLASYLLKPDIFVAALRPGEE